MIDAAAFGSKEDDELFYNIINAKDTSKEIVCFLTKQRDSAAAKEMEKLVMQAEKEKLVTVMQAEISMINTKFTDAQREINSNTPRDIIGNSPTFSFHNFILA